MKLRAYLVDDEPPALRRLRRLLDRTGRVEIIGSTTDSEQAIAELQSDPPDVCFLDIQMPSLNGFEVLERLPVQPIVIFTTAYDQYALKAFTVNSVDYLLKPIEPEQLDRALAKVEHLRSFETPSKQSLQKLISDLSDTLRESRAEYPDRIASRLGDRLWFVDLPRVTHFFAEDKLTYAAADGKSYCVDYTISELQEKLNPKKFVRIHRSTLVNIDWIKEITSLPGGGLNVRLKDANGTDLAVSRDRARDLKARLF